MFKLFAAVTVPVLLFAGSAALALPHYDLDMTSFEYERAVRAQEQWSLQEGLPLNKSPDLETILEFGRRNLDWVAHINKHRSDQPPISLSSAATQQAFPIDSPRVYNAQIVRQQYDEFLPQLPAEMRKVLVENGAFTDAPPVDEKTFVELGLRADRIYQLAARWRLMEPYLDALAQRKKHDIRGYYFLSRTEGLKDQLDRFGQLAEKTKAQFRGWLLNLCAMMQSASTCQSSLEQAVGKGQVWNFYSRFEGYARTTWDSYFAIPRGRPDVQWNADTPMLMRVPFAKPPSQDVVDFLRDNIEDEWRWKTWQLRLNFVQTDDEDTTHIVFVPGVTPNVNGLSGSTITMDANAPLTEYNVQWTIRHEYGHTLGFPDCYLEFYDRDSGQIISYQFDITNLMCSRRGHLNEGHIKELQRVYYKAKK